MGRSGHRYGPPPDPRPNTASAGYPLKRAISAPGRWEPVRGSYAAARFRSTFLGES